MKVKVKKLNPAAILPTQGSSDAAGWDLYVPEGGEDIAIIGGGTEMIHTGIAFEIPKGYFGAIYARSGLATKHKLRPANCVGIIDSDYRGEVIVALHNDGERATCKTIKPGERIAQLIIQEYSNIEFELVEELNDTERGEGGFGSTGTN